MAATAVTIKQEFTKEELQIIKAALEAISIKVTQKSVLALYEKVVAELKGQGE